MPQHASHAQPPLQHRYSRVHEAACTQITAGHLHNHEAVREDEGGKCAYQTRRILLVPRARMRRNEGCAGKGEDHASGDGAEERLGKGLVRFVDARAADDFEGF